MRHPVRFLALTVLCLLPPTASPDEIDDLLKDLRAVGAQGQGSTKARAAWDRLILQGPKVLPRILTALDTPDPVAANWLRLAFDAIVAPAEKAGGKEIDTEALLTFIRDPKRHGRPRRLAIDLVERLRPGTREKLLGSWLDDPEFRYEAVEHLLKQVQHDKDLPKEKLVAALQRAFRSSRDLEQVRTAALRLKEHGVVVRIADHLGFLPDWFIIGPFDAKGGKGFTVVYPPEKKIDLDATLEGKDGKKLRWQRRTIPEEARARFPILVDFRKSLGDADDAVAYAWTTFAVPVEQTVEFRGAGDDNFSVWINGERAFGFEEYQNGVRLDRHRFPVKLKKGTNTVLVKVCQAPRDPDNYTPNWEFFLRITDPTGLGLTFPAAAPLTAR